MTDQRNSASSWTLETLHEHIGEVCRMNEKRIDERFAAMEKATALGLKTAAVSVEKAERLADERAKAQDRLAEATKLQQNEWRGTVNDISATKMGREEYESKHVALIDKIDALSARIDRIEGRSLGSSATWVWLFVGMAALVGLVGVVFDIIIHLT